MRKLLFVCTLFLAVACSDEEKPKAPATFKTDLKTNEIDFGETLVKKQVGKEITITNSGEEDLVLKSFAISGKDAKSFTTKATKENVAGGKTYKVSLTFLPLSPGNKTADLTIVSNIGTHKITLKGKGKAPATFETDLKTNEIDFGETLVKKQVGKEITITNSGEEDLVLKSFAISGKDAKSFTTKATKENVAGGKTYKVSLTFLPLSPGNKTADLTIVSNIGTHKITLKGNSKGLPLVIENPYDKDNVGRGNIISNNPQRTMKLAFDIDVEANSTYMIKKITINTTGKNPNNPNDNLPFDFKIIIHKDKDGVPNEPLMETETKLEKSVELEGRLLGGQSQAFSRELSMKKPVILKADKKTKYWLEIVCISRPAIGIETRANTVMGLVYAGFNPMTKKWVVSNEQAKEDVIYKLEGEKY